MAKKLMLELEMLAGMESGQECGKNWPRSPGQAAKAPIKSLSREILLVHVP